MRTHRRFPSVRVVQLLMTLVLLIGLVAGGMGRAASGPDPEPKAVMPTSTNIPKGPGWPAGWAPPPAPTGLPADAADSLAWEQKTFGDKAPARQDWRVLPYMPDWTKEYPWLWATDIFTCGKTEYYYYYPAPDRDALKTAFGRDYVYGVKGGGGSDCTFTGVVMIADDTTTPEEKERQRLMNLLSDAFDYATLGSYEKGGLAPCGPDREDRSPDNIFVCFNNGNASARFDASAYLDTTVGRVRVPVRFVSEMMRADVQWSGDTKTVTIHFPAISRQSVKPVPKPGMKPSDWVNPEKYTYDGSTFDLVEATISQPERTIVLTVGQNTALVDGKEVKLDAPPVIVPPGRTMIPVRFVAEAMNAKVYWVGKEPIFRNDQGGLSGRYQVHIFTTFYPFYEYPSWFLENRAQRF